MPDPNQNPVPGGSVDPNAVSAGVSQSIDDSGAADMAKKVAAANPQPAQPVAPPPPVATSKNPALHNLIGSVLGGLAGHPPPSYSYGQDGKLIVTAAPPESSADKIRRIASNALTGLSAGGGPEKKSGLANILTGVGAGSKAVEEKAKEQDILKRSQAKENFEQEQQAMLRKHEIARQNALTYATHLDNEKKQNDLNPAYAENESLFKAVKDSPELGAHAVEMSGTQVLQEAQKDPTFTQTHILKPLGRAPELDENGSPVLDENGAPKEFMRYAVINGTKDGKITVTPEMAEDFKKYGPMARIPNAADIKAGDSYELSQLLPMMNKTMEQRKNVQQGWEHAELGTVKDEKTGKESYVETNKVLQGAGIAGSSRPIVAKPLSVMLDEAKTDDEKAQAREHDAKAKESLANAALISTGVGAGDKTAIPAYMDAISKLPASSQAILRSVPPTVQMSLLKVANGDADVNKIFPTRTTKGSGQLDASRATNLAVLLNPNWSEQMFKEKQGVIDKLSKDPSIASFNQFMVHADDARQASEKLQRTNSPWLNQPLNTIRSKGMGDPGVPALMADIQAARSEWQTFIKSGHAADIADNDNSRIILSDTSSPAQVLGALREMGKQAAGRLDQIDAQYRRAYGAHYPGLISDSGRQAAINLGLGDAIKQYPAEATFGNAQPPSGQQLQSPDNPAQRPAGATGIAPGSDGKMYYHDIKGNILGPAPASVQ